MRINSQEQIAFATNRSLRNANHIEKSVQKLASGLKIAKSSDNAAGFAISETMRTQVRGLAQAQRNMQDGLSLLEVTDEGLNNVNGLLQRARELAVMNANGTLTDNDRVTSQQELTRLLEGINDTAEKLEFNTKNILGGNSSLILQIGANPTQEMTINLVDISTTALNLNDASLLTREFAEQLITKIDDAFEITATHLTQTGSYMEALEHRLRNATLFEANLTKSLSMIEDTDVAREMMNFISLDIRQKGDHLLVNQVNRTLHDSLGLFSK